MNKVKMFFIAAALVLTTAGVFATRVTTFQLYAEDGTNYYQFDQSAASALGSGIATSGTSNEVVSVTGKTLTLGLYYFDSGSSSYHRIYSTGW